MARRSRAASAARLADLVLALGLFVHGCGDEVETGSNQQRGGLGASGGDDAGGAGGPHEIATCQGKIYQCGDLLDNDGDGLVDSEDPDCLGPCDNTEESYYGGIPGQNEAPCRQDCYFDQDTGPGNDNCYWSHKCDPLSVAPGFPPSGDSKCGYARNTQIPGTSLGCDQLAIQQLQQCERYCLPLTPNGCDCFGCCELPTGSGNYVWLGSVVNNVGSCERAQIADPTKCMPCTPVTACLNDCAECELCIGKAVIPEHCRRDDAGTGTQCAPGIQPCGLPEQELCPPRSYCITGCCIPVPE
jgi:hypothetical protein